MKDFLPTRTYNMIRPVEQIRRAYGVIKRHKLGHPIRPIVSSIGAMTEGSEKFLKDILKKFVSDCSYSVESVKEFKSLFLKNRHKFDASAYEIVSFDAVSMHRDVQ